MNGIGELRLRNFKAFDRFTLSFGQHVFLVGPNNAGKSTLVSAVRTCVQVVRLAAQKSPDLDTELNGKPLLAYSFSGERFGLIEENLRHEFRPVETSLRLSFDEKQSVTVVWPDEDNRDSQPHFMLEVPGKPQPRRPLDVRREFPTVAVVPILAPVDRSEEVLTEAYVRQNLDGHLSSRHLRNQLLLLQNQDSARYRNQLEEFLAFSSPWLSEIEITSVRTRDVPKVGREIDVFYREPGKRGEKELCWAGDGIQVWLQLLLHVFRARGASSIILDEPDLYLHADLQRRLLRLLESRDAQTITATHSPEILAEVASSSVMWVDKSRKAAVEASRAPQVESLSDALGSQFNLRAARALRARAVLFVEGSDMRLLAQLAGRCGASRVEHESRLAVIPLRGYSKWPSVDAFGWFVRDFLKDATPTFVLLDRDYRSDSVVQSVLSELAKLGIEGHVWARKEIENYLLVPSAIARLAGADQSDAQQLQSAVIETFESQVFSQMLFELQAADTSATNHPAAVAKEFHASFGAMWQEPKRRLELVPGKLVITAINRSLAGQGFQTVSARRLAATLRQDEIDVEVRDWLGALDDSLG